MQTIDRFTLIPRVDTEDGSSELWAGGRRISQNVPGVSLEAQFAIERVDSGPYLLLTTYDVPHEETLHVLLVSERGELLEQVKLGAPYTPGILKDVRVLSPNSLSFDFQGLVHLTVHARPRGLPRRRLQVERSVQARGS